MIDKNESNKEIKDNDMVYNVAENESNFIQMVEMVNSLVKRKSTEKNRTKVFNEIKKLHYNISHLWTNYLVESNFANNWK